MPFQPGQKRPANAGRRKGTPNRPTPIVREILEARNADLINDILDDLSEMDDPYNRARVRVSLLPYVYPRLQAIHHTIEHPPEEREVQTKTFEEFVAATAYPSPFPLQSKMMQFAIFGTEPRLLLGARGYGKTDYGPILGVAFRIYLDPEFTVLIVTKSKERNAAMLAEIAAACAANGMVFSKENSTTLRLSTLEGNKDHSVSALTIGSKQFRGRHPDLILMDDPVTEDDVSEATRRKVTRVYNELTKLVKNICIIGQPAHKFDLYETLRPLLDKMEVPHGSIPELDHDLKAQLLAGVSEESISASYHLKVISENSSPLEGVKYIDDFYPGDAIAFIDPSFEGGDYTALSIVKGYFEGVAVQGHLYKRAWNHCIEEMVREIVKRGVRKVCFETNSLGDQPIILLRSIPKLNSIGVIGKKSTGNKHARIMAAGNFAHLIHLSKTSDRQYIEQVTKYEYGAKHDDGPDSLAGALEWAGLIKGRGKS